MEKKKCPRCSETKSVEDFNKKGRGYSAYCKLCNREYLRSHYYNNKAYYVDKAKRAKKKTAARVRAYKESNPCQDCGQFFRHYVMDFDHVDPSSKRNCVSFLLSYGDKTVDKEIAKCELVCANCHRERTHGGK